MSITGPAMCKICGHQHYRYQPHVFADHPTEPKRTVARKPTKPQQPRIPAPHEQPATRDTDTAENGIVYFVQAPKSGPVKIAWSRNRSSFDGRLRSLQSGHHKALVVIRVLAAPRWAEAWLHNFFASLQARGEWFTFSDDMLLIQPPASYQKPEPNPLDAADFLVRCLPDDLLNQFRRVLMAEYMRRRRQKPT